MNKHIAVLLALALLAGCGAETAGTAAAGAAIKKQELQQGQKTLEQAQQRVGQALDAQQQRAASSDEK